MRVLRKLEFQWRIIYNAQRKSSTQEYARSHFKFSAPPAYYFGIEEYTDEAFCAQHKRKKNKKMFQATVDSRWKKWVCVMISGRTSGGSALHFLEHYRCNSSQSLKLCTVTGLGQSASASSEDTKLYTCLISDLIHVITAWLLNLWTKWSIQRLSIGRFSEAGLLEWMRFVIFRERSRERSQRTSGPISE